MWHPLAQPFTLIHTHTLALNQGNRLGYALSLSVFHAMKCNYLFGLTSTPIIATFNYVVSLTRA